MENDRVRWNQRFLSEKSFLGEKPSSFLVTHIELIESIVPGCKALDIACGEGRNSIFLARRNFAVTGLDISDAGIEKAGRNAEKAGVVVDFLRVDLDDYRFKGKYDLIINFNFLQRDLVPEMVAALPDGGVIIFDSILESPELERLHNPDYLLRKGELDSIFRKYDGAILVSEEVREGEMPTARLIFQKM